MAEEGEGNIINVRKRKSTEPIPDLPDQKSTKQEGPPSEKLFKRNDHSDTTNESIQVQLSILPTEAFNSDISQDDEKQVTASLEPKDEAATNSNDISPGTFQLQNDLNNFSYTDNKSIIIDETIMNGKEDGSFQNTDCKLNDTEINQSIQDNIEDLQAKVYRIFENQFIVLDSTLNTSFREDESKPIITISFSNKEVFENYGEKFSAFCKMHSEFQVKQDTGNFLIELIKNCDANLNHYASQRNSIDKFDTEQDVNQHKNSKRKPSKVKKELFTLDATPSISTSASGCQYTSKFAAISIEPIGNDGNSVKKQNWFTCFNCDGNHNMKDCSLPKNYEKINQARNKFPKKYQQINRYHDDEEQKYSHIRPGNISSGLRNAMGLSENQVPSFVYRMRIHGYPPGWIEEATEHGSSMAVFGIDGKVADTGMGGSRFNATKVVQYVGFNVKLEKGMRDEYVKNNVPPFSKDHGTDAMLTYIRNAESTRNDNKEVCDMDLDQGDEENSVGNDELETIQHTLPPGCEDENSSNDTKTSLGDLESQKQQLLAELNESQSQENSQDAEPTSTDNESSCVQNTTMNANTSQSLQEHTPSNRLKDSEFGTPVIKSASPYSHLPNPENFSVGVSEVINFENLPNSTGAYEKMTGLISRVRESLKSVQYPPST